MKFMLQTRLLLLVIVATLLLSSCNSFGQTNKKAVKEAELYCNSETSKYWKLEGWYSGGLSSYIKHNGKYYQDTTSTPPAKRLKQLMWSSETPRDTSIAQVECDELLPIVLKITECATCELKETPAYIKVCRTQYFSYALFQDVLTKKIYVDGSGWGRGGSTTENIYYDRDKKPFSKSVTIWQAKN